MAIQDLTPQLRTRLNRMERAVGWFLFLAMALLIFGFSYYIYKTAENRGWFKNKAKYFIFADSAKNLVPGTTPVELLGKNVGTVTRIEPMPARGEGSEYNVYVEFEILEPYYGYVWTEGSQVTLTSDNPLTGNLVLDVSRGTNGYNTYIAYPVKQMSLDEIQNSSARDNLRLGQDVYSGTNLLFKAWRPVTNLTGITNTDLWIIDHSLQKARLTAVWNEKGRHYEPLTESTKPYELPTVQEVALTDRLEAMIGQVQDALPGILALTNKINAVLDNTATLTSNLNEVANNARPAASNLAVITANLRDPKGSLGDWLIPTNLNAELNSTLLNANVTITNADTNMVMLAESIEHSLNNLADITSNLNQQVQSNSNILTQISDIVVNADQFVQGLKHFWLLRSAFKTPKTNAPVANVSAPGGSPRANGQNQR